MRPEYDRYWYVRIWLEVPAALALARGIERDAEMEGRDEAERIHRDRYNPAEALYISEVDPQCKADVIIDNTDYANPIMRRLSHRVLTGDPDDLTSIATAMGRSQPAIIAWG